MPRPKFAEEKAPAALAVFIKPVVLQPILALAVAVLYLRRATTGLENHLKKVAFSFFLLTFYELLGLAVLFEGTKTSVFTELTGAFGPCGITEHLILLVAAILLANGLSDTCLKEFKPAFLYFC